MARNKMEKDFSEKLNRREISPSANAWDRLDAMLTVAEEKKPKKDFGWMYMAASIAGFLLIGTVYLSSTREMTDSRRNDVVLENPSPQTENNSGFETSQPAEAIAETENPIANDTNNNPSEPIKSIQKIRKINQSQLADHTINQNQINPSHSINNQKTNSVSNVVATPKADELLAMAQANFTQESPKSTVKVNAKSLLSQVDGELELSFRDKVINSVGKNYRNAKSALANRNSLEEENH